MHNGENAFEVLLCLYKQCKHHTRDAFSAYKLIGVTFPEKNPNERVWFNVISVTKGLWVEISRKKGYIKHLNGPVYSRYYSAAADAQKMTCTPTGGITS